MIVSKIPGRDLRYELPFMEQSQITRLAEHIVGFQRKLGGLPRGNGFSWVSIGKKGTHRTWKDCLSIESLLVEGWHSNETSPLVLRLHQPLATH